MSDRRIFRGSARWAWFALWLGLWLSAAGCQSPQVAGRQQQIDRLQPDVRMRQAEEWYRQNQREWALYAWNQTKPEQLSQDGARESYRLLQHWLFSQQVHSSQESAGSAEDNFGSLASLSDVQVSALFLDYDDLWLGTWNGGIIRLSLSSGESFVLEPDRASLVPRVVYRIRKSGNALWFAMHQGLRYYNYQTGTNDWLRMVGIAEAISDFLENSQGLFVASLSQGLWQRTYSGDLLPIGRQGKQGEQAMEAAVTALAYQSDIGLVIGTARTGAFRWKNAIRQPLGNVEPILGGLKHVNHIVDDGSSLWFASSGEGLFRWNYRKSQAYQMLAETSLLRSDHISALHQSGDWVFAGDERGGIAAYHLGDQRWYAWDNGQNLEFSRISALAYGDGKLFYSPLAGGVYQIHWLKYLLALRQKQDLS